MGEIKFSNSKQEIKRLNWQGLCVLVVNVEILYYLKCTLLTPKIPCGFWTNLGNFGHSWRNPFSQKFKSKK
jgi:hypothetical protein